MSDVTHIVYKGSEKLYEGSLAECQTELKRLASEGIIATMTTTGGFETAMSRAAVIVENAEQVNADLEEIVAKTNRTKMAEQVYTLVWRQVLRARWDTSDYSEALKGMNDSPRFVRPQSDGSVRYSFDVHRKIVVDRIEPTPKQIAWVIGVWAKFQFLRGAPVSFMEKYNLSLDNG